MDPRHHQHGPSPQRPVVTLPHRQPSPQRPVVTPHRQPSPQRPVVTPHRQPSPKRPVVTPHRQASPKRPVITPHRQASPKRPVVHTTYQTPKYTDDKPTVRIYCKAKPDYSLTIRDGKVVLAPINLSDSYQHWIKAVKVGMRVDEEGMSSFALVNKATGQAMEHSIFPYFAVQLTNYVYNPDKVDESVLWTQSRHLGDGYRPIRKVNNIRLTLDAYNGDKEHGGVHTDTKVVLWDWKNGDNQRWSIAPF